MNWFYLLIGATGELFRLASLLIGEGAKSSQSNKGFWVRSKHLCYWSARWAVRIYAELYR